MHSWSRFPFKALFVSSAAAMAAAIGIICIALINLAPVVFWGYEILLASPFFTGIPSLVAGIFVFRWCFIRQMEWFDAGFPESQQSPSRPQLLFSSVTLLAGLAALFVAVNGLYPRFFELAQREEIRLGNGGLTVVDTLRTYERLGALRLSEFKNVRLHSTQLSFEPATGEPRVSFKTQLQPVYLNQIEGVWYLVLTGQDDRQDPIQSKDKEDWGNNYNTLGQRLAILNGHEFKPATWEKAPRSIVFQNLLPADPLDLPNAKTAEKHLMTLYEKQTRAYRYVNTPLGPDPLRITRSEAMKTPLLTEYQEAVADLVKPP